MQAPVLIEFSKLLLPIGHLIHSNIDNILHPDNNGICAYTHLHEMTTPRIYIRGAGFEHAQDNINSLITLYLKFVTRH